MYVVSSFEYSLHLELAISELEINGITRDNILAIPLDKNLEKKKIFDTIHYADGISLFDLAAGLGTACMVLGVIYGYVLQWGPIIWGIIGLFLGSFIGFIIDFYSFKKKEKTHKKTPKKTSEVILIIKCKNEDINTIKSVLKENLAIGIGEFNDSLNNK